MSSKKEVPKFEYFTCIAEIRPVTIVMKFAEIVSLLGSILLMVQKSLPPVDMAKYQYHINIPIVSKKVYLSQLPHPDFEEPWLPSFTSHIPSSQMCNSARPFSFFARRLPEAATPDPHRGQGSRHKLGGGFGKIKPRCRWPWNLWNRTISAFLRCFCGAQQLWHIKNMYTYNYNIIWFNYFFRCDLIHIWFFF